MSNKHTKLTKRDCDRIRMNVQGLENATDQEIQAILDDENKRQDEAEVAA